MLTPKLLVITHQKAYECDTLIDGLNSEEIPFLRYNLDLDTPSKIAFEFGDKLKFYLECDDKKVDASKIEMAYFHQTLPERLYQDNKNQAITSIRRAINIQMLFSLESLLSAKWLNKPSAVQKASNKISQLKIAMDLDLAIPKTLISNNPKSIRTFTKNSKNIIKNIASPKYFLDSTEEDYFEAETVEFDKQWLNNPEALSFSPLIYQAKVKKKRELRIVVLGKEIFAAECEADTAFLDYRVREDLVEKMKPCELPEQISRKLIKMLEIYDLQYGSFDMLVDEKDNFLFLELNPTGAFGWIDKSYGGQIYKAFVKYLQKSLSSFNGGHNKV